ncbi:phosphoribosyltransferase-like protein [Paractinoplanes durhamensis]|uniref:phosphoribosyltransferase-like protein n=1 Tax=Paractinoplanes durhamensis TaxID=113563 RepID=UPI0019423B87|nr:hypothetical protein [Actinoplanes durhamensis]
MAVRPSETLQGSRWLANFAIDERRPATLLIDSLRVISSSDFRIAVSNALDAAINELPKPVGIYPVRELPNGNSSQLLPLEHPYAAIPGSEGIVGNIIREAAGRRPKFNRAASYDSLDKLLRHKVRTVLLVDDYSGTGDQIVKYVGEWTRHPTIKSWHSYGLIRIHVLLLAPSAHAQRRLEDHRYVESVRFVERGLGFDTAPWTKEERESVEALCRRYAYSPGFSLGYGKTRGLLTLHHTVPNNLPCILWQTTCPRISDWKPLFGNRRMSPQLQTEIGDYRLETDPRRIAAIIRQERLGEVLDGLSNPTTRNLLLTLGAVESGHRDPVGLSGLLSLSLEAIRRILEACQDLRLLDSTGRLTDEGRMELRRARNRPPTPRPELLAVGDQAPYYPQRLRGAM